MLTVLNVHITPNKQASERSHFAESKIHSVMFYCIMFYPIITAPSIKLIPKSPLTGTSSTTFPSNTPLGLS